MKPDVVRILKEHGIQPSAQRVAVAEYVLHTPEHPSAEKVWARVRESFPMISRATVYNTLNLFVEKGLLRELHLAPDSVLFDANTDRHHHFIDEDIRPDLRCPLESDRSEERETAAGVRGSRVSSGDARSSPSHPRR